MEAKLVHEQHGQRTFVIILETGKEIIHSLGGFASKERISAAQISAIGALSEVELNYFDCKEKRNTKKSQ
jgi:predicted DNA-binding protein with PD1-like motif